MAFVQVHQSVEVGKPGSWQLCYQLVTYHYETGQDSPEHGYRYIWRRPDGRLQGARGQARLPDGATQLRLQAKAAIAGWFFSTEPEVARYVSQLLGVSAGADAPMESACRAERHFAAE